MSVHLSHFHSLCSFVSRFSFRTGRAKREFRDKGDKNQDYITGYASCCDARRGAAMRAWVVPYLKHGQLATAVSVPWPHYAIFPEYFFSCCCFIYPEALHFFCL